MFVLLKLFKAHSPAASLRVISFTAVKMADNRLDKISVAHANGQILINIDLSILMAKLIAKY